MAINKNRQAGNRVIPTLKDKVEFTDIVNDDVTGGTQVPVSAEVAMNLRDAVSQETTSRSQAIVDLKGGVSLSNNTLGKLETNLNAEIADRTTAVANEATRTDAAILVEKNRAEAEEASLQGQINSLGTSSGTDLANEIARAQGEEARIEARLDAEIATTDSEVTKLNAGDSVTGSVSQKVKVETDRATAAEAVLISRISNEETRATGSETTLQNNINTLSSTVGTNKTAIESALGDEIQNRIAGDSALSSRVAQIEGGLVAGVVWKGSVATLLELDALDESDQVAGWAYYVVSEKDVYVVLPDVGGDYQPAGFTGKSFLKIADFKELTGLVTAEKNRAEAAEAQLQQAIATEATTRSNEDSNLQNNIDAEEAARIADVATLTTGLANEVTARDAAIQVEANRATTAEQAIENDVTVLNGDASTVGSVSYKVAQESATARAAEQANATAIANEVANRTADVDAEETRALAAEGVLDARITNEISTVVNSVDAERTRAMAAEQALDARSDVFEGDIYTPGSIAAAEGNAKSYADSITVKSKIEGVLTPSYVVGDSVTLGMTPMTDGIVFGEIIIYKADQAGVNEAIATNVLSITGNVATLDCTAGEFDGCNVKVHYFYREIDQSGSGQGESGSGGAGE